MTTLVNVIIALVIVGLLLYVIDNWLPVDAKIKKIINVVVIIAVILWLLREFLPGVLG